MAQARMTAMLPAIVVSCLCQKMRIQADQKDLTMRHPFPMNLVLDGTAPAGGSTRQHLTEQLRKALLSGAVAPGDPLPSTRVFAEAMGVSRGSVISAYEDLAGEGYVVTVPGGGTYVSASLPEGRRPDFDPLPPPEPRSVDGGLEPYQEGIDLDSNGDGPLALVNLSPGSPSTRFHTHRDWNAAWRTAVTRGMPALPPPAAGCEEARTLIAEHLLIARGVRCAPEDILLTAGTSDGLGLLVHALLDACGGEVRIATENPGYPAARSVISRLGATPIPIPVRDGGLDITALEQAPDPLDAALVTPSHQYPLGGRLPVAARLQLLEWAKRRDSIIIEDDYDSEFRHGAPSLPAIASLDDARRVVLVGSYSKTLSPWLRCGYLVVPDPELRERLIEARRDLGQPLSGIVQTALAEFLRTGGLRKHLVRVGREYAHRRALVVEAMKDLAPRFALNAVEGGLHATLTWDDGPATHDIVEQLMHAGVVVSPLTSYYYPEPAPPREGIVFGYGSPTDLQVQTALRRIASALSEPARSSTTERPVS